MKDPAGEFLRYLDHQRGASRHTLRSYAADLWIADLTAKS